MPVRLERLSLYNNGGTTSPSLSAAPNKTSVQLGHEPQQLGPYGMPLEPTRQLVPLFPLHLVIGRLIPRHSYDKQATNTHTTGLGVAEIT